MPTATQQDVFDPQNHAHHTAFSTQQQDTASQAVDFGDAGPVQEFFPLQPQPTAEQKGTITRSHISHNLTFATPPFLGHQRHGFQPPTDGLSAESPPVDPPSKKRKRKAPTLHPDVWKPHKSRILELHVKQALPLKEVQELIKAETGFTANLRQYRTRISQWGCDKNVKPDEMEAIVRKQQHRKLNEFKKRPLSFKLRGKTVENQKIDRWMQSKGISRSALYAPIPAAATPSALSCWTASESGSPASSPLPICITSTSVPCLTEIALAYQQASPIFSFSEAIDLSGPLLASRSTPRSARNYLRPFNVSSSPETTTIPVGFQSGFFTLSQIEESDLHQPEDQVWERHNDGLKDPTHRENSRIDIGNVTAGEILDEQLTSRKDRPTTADLLEMDNFNSRPQSPASSEASISSPDPLDRYLSAEPRFHASSPEMLMLRFDKQTCGILSMKDGPTENPWRTLIWPLARESPALYYAVSAMTAFHGSRDEPTLRVSGMRHVMKSMTKLAQEMNTMGLDCALATSLVLAQSERWDTHVSTGVQHLRGARIMVFTAINAIVRHRWTIQAGKKATHNRRRFELERLEFLCNTFVYMDVITRLTSLEEGRMDFEEILLSVNQSKGELVDVDPLMGCATTLFPLIGRAAALIQKVRKMNSNTLVVISQAQFLKEQLEGWLDPRIFERPEDPNCEVLHSIQTAEAYRYAMLLYLHQAVPEIPSEPSKVLAKRTLVALASVPLTSRTSIVHIFPLLAAGCELTDDEDREWLSLKWAGMITRLKTGIPSSCWNVVKETWSRRDCYEAEKTKRTVCQSLSPMEKADTPFEQLEPAYTVRGKLHWLGVMQDWGWEVFLG